MALTDTHPEVARMQLRLLREASPTRRFQMANSLTRSTIRWSRRAIRAAMPDASDDEVAVRWVQLVYGDGLAERFRKHLDGRNAR